MMDLSGYNATLVLLEGCHFARPILQCGTVTVIEPHDFTGDALYLFEKASA
jgi:hypothetical protein